MHKTLLIILTLFSLSVSGQNKLTKDAQAIVTEGKLLYKSEMASWHGTDLFLEAYPDRNNIGGYFSYMDKDIPTCVFFSKSETPKIIGTILFDSTYHVETAQVRLAEREFSQVENDLYQIRKITLATIRTDSLFKTYDNTSLNLIPLINGQEKKVYVLTGPQQHGVVIFGNDYLLTFDKDNKLVQKKQLHKNIIPIYFGGIDEAGNRMESAMHNHSSETGDYITATDICTLMLYSKFANWKTHQVVSKEYLNVWDCEANTLAVIPMKTIEKINKDQEKRNKKRKNE